MIYVLLVLATILRFTPHIPSFTPLFAILLLAGRYLRRPLGLLVPVVILGLGDLVLTPFVYHTMIGWSQLFVWLAFAVAASFGGLLQFGVGRKGLAVVSAPISFFFLANLGVWIGGSMYPHTTTGLLACYAAAVPFYRNALLSTAAWSAVLLPIYQFWLTHVRVATHNPA
jgi:hypothetical protein